MLILYYIYYYIMLNLISCWKCDSDTFMQNCVFIERIDLIIK